MPAEFLKKYARCNKCREVFLVEESEILEIPGNETQVDMKNRNTYSNSETEVDQSADPAQKPQGSAPVRKSIAERYEGRAAAGAGFSLESVFILVFSAGAIVGQILPWRFISQIVGNPKTTSGIESVEGAMSFILSIFAILLITASFFVPTTKKLIKAITLFLPATMFVYMISLSFLYLAGAVAVNPVVGVGHSINFNYAGTIAMFIVGLTIFFSITSKPDAVLKGLVGLFIISLVLLIVNMVITFVGGKQPANTSPGIGVFLNLGCATVSAVFSVILCIRRKILVWQQ